MGTRAGWVISGLIVAGAISVAAFVMVQPNSVGPATEATTGAGKLDLIVMHLDLDRLVRVPEGAGAEAIYEQAAKEALDGQEMEAFIATARHPDPLSDPKLAGVIGKLVAAGEKGLDPGAALLFRTLPPIQAINDIPTETFLKAMGHLLTNAAAGYHADGKNGAALKTANAALLFGDRLWRQGVYNAYRNAGQSVAGDALVLLAMIYTDLKNDTNAAACRELDAQRKAAAMRWLEKNRICRQLNQGLVPGDLANLALHDQDRSWRLEGTMWLGVAQWVSASGRQRRAIQTLLNTLERNEDFYIAEQARAAGAIERSTVHELAAQAQ